MDNKEKIEEWKALLDEGEIDEETFKQEVAFIKLRENKKKIKQEKKIKAKEEYEKKHANTYANKKKREVAYKRNKDLFSSIIVIIIVVIIIISGIIIFLNRPKKIVEKVHNLYALSEPIQKKVLGSKNYKINGHDIRLVYQASYSISGRVISKFKYFPFKMDNKIRKFDLGMAWGSFASDENRSKYVCASPGDRFLHLDVKKEALKEFGGKYNLGKSFSHNHLIPFSKKIEKLIDSIKIDDFVRLEGYLVNVYDLSVSNDSSVMTSMTREDMGNHACETMLVTDVVWLKDDIHNVER